MAFPELAKANTIPPMYRMKQDGIIDELIFSFWLRGMDEDDGLENGGEIEIGGYDQSKIKSGSKLTWIDITKRPYWELDLKEAYIDGHERYHGKVVIDSGTSMIIVPSRIARDINNALGGAYSEQSGYYMVDCNQVEQMPNFRFKLGNDGYEFDLQPREYIIRYMDECYSTISGFDIQANGGPVWILGDAFLRHYYAVFDAENERIGLAPINKQ